MPIYSYACARGHRREVLFPIGQAAEAISCVECLKGGSGDFAYRDLHAELSSQSVLTSDPYRKAWLSSTLESELARQERPLDPLAPKCQEDVKKIADATGRIYIGDDTSTLKPKVRESLHAYAAEKGLPIT